MFGVEWILFVWEEYVDFVLIYDEFCCVWIDCDDCEIVKFVIFVIDFIDEFYCCIMG